MRILAVETSTSWCSVALYLDGEVRTQSVDAGQRHSELLLPMARALMESASVAVGDLNGIAFGGGPGSFTGVRIACGVAQGIALGAGLRLAPVCTLLALAQACVRDRVLVCQDARLGELYLAAYERQGDAWREHVAPMLCKPENSPVLMGSDWFGVGSGFNVMGEAISARYAGQLAAFDGTPAPQAREVAILGARAFAQGRSVAPSQAAPLYIRDKVALTTAERQAQ